MHAAVARALSGPDAACGASTPGNAPRPRCGRMRAGGTRGNTGQHGALPVGMAALKGRPVALWAVFSSPPGAAAETGHVTDAERDRYTVLVRI